MSLNTKKTKVMVREISPNFRAIWKNWFHSVNKNM
jgi:hypothetical protein